MESKVQTAKQTLVEDFSKIVTDAEALLKAVRDVPGDKVQGLRASAEARLGAAKERLSALQEGVVDKATAAAKVTDTYVHDNPWPLIGAAALAGFVVGLMVRGGGDSHERPY
jgi:ElaB/YqjD/DUF883 family membrane-anchored ribosome-binding protein